MALFGTLNTGASGLSATSTAMSVIGDNIANINTTGFKSSRADFADMIPQGLGSINGPQQMGTGVGLSQLRSFFGQGSLNGTGSALDMAISGNGFFQVQDGDESFYTRDGSFYMNNDGYIVTAGGLRLQGYNPLDDGSIIPRPGDLRIDTSPISPKETTEVVFNLTLPEHDSNFNNQLSSGALVLDGNTVTFDDVQTANEDIWYTTSTIYDAAGKAHEVTYMFEWENANTVTYKAVVDGAEVGQTEGFLYEIGEGQIDLVNGEIVTSSWQITQADTFTDASGVAAFEVLLGKDINGDDTDGGVMAGDGAGTVNSVSQDGYGIGEVTGVHVDDDGIITANYTNGEELVLGQVILATFNSQQGLRRLGGNLFQSSYASGEPAIGEPGTGSRGDLQGFALENSNVELEHEFVKMIQSQRSYQANARVISTANDTLTELVNLV